MKRIPMMILILTLALCAPACAENLLIGQAANFTPAMQEIIPAFKKATGIDVQATYTSTGKLYAQITNGAPFDIFLAADERRPQKLYKQGLSEKPFIYAKGKVVFWSLDKTLSAVSWQKAVQNRKMHKIAIANIETAPYGTAAMLAMQKVGLWKRVEPQLVFAQTIAQVFQYASTGAADAGFCAYSSTFTETGKKGSFTIVKEAPAVIQSACLLKSSKNKDAAVKFISFLSGAEATSIKKKYGYD